MTKNKLLLCICAAIGFVAALALFVAMLLPPKATPQAPTTQATTEATTLPPPTENVFTPLDFGYEGDYLTCLTAESILGIDVSNYQGDIDWQQVKDAGVEFVIIRAAFRGYGNGLLYEDLSAQRNYQGAKAAGLKVGAYIFSQAISVEEAREEAQYIMDITKNWELDMPLVYDWECLADDYRTAGVDARQLTDYTIAFCDAVEAAGFDSMIYFNPDQSHKQMYLAELTGYGFWLAMYTDQMEYPYKVDMWQYTNQGTVPGIAGNVDINLYFPYNQDE